MSKNIVGYHQMERKQASEV